MKLSHLATLGIGECVGADVSFSSVSTDTRTLSEGDLFIALVGERFDAHTLIDQAVAKGACALVVEKEMDVALPQLVVKDTTKALGLIGNAVRKTFSGKVIALTGSCGKTGVKGMLASILDGAGGVIATKGNLNNHIGVPLTLCRLSEEKPYAVIEAGTSGRGEISYLTELIDPDISLVINVRAAHTEGIGSLDDIAREKSSIYSSASKEAIAIVNLDEPKLDKLLAAVGQRSVLAFSKQHVSSEIKLKIKTYSGNVYASEMQVLQDGCINFTLEFESESCPVKLAVPGPHNLENALAASACACALGISLSQIKKGLESYSGTPGRMQVLKGIKNTRVVDDTYNANPGSMMAALDYLANFEKTIFVCGAMGELGKESEKLHTEVGLYAEGKNIKHVVAVGGDARFIATAAGGEYFETKEAAIPHIKNMMNENFTVLVKGSRSVGMEVVVKALALEEVN